MLFAIEVSAQSVTMMDDGVAYSSGISDMVYDSLSQQLFITGDFKGIEGVKAKQIARWDGTQWFDVGFESDGKVNALLYHNGILFAAGDFNTVNGIYCNNVCKWDGNTWTAVGSGINGQVLDIAVFQDSVYAVNSLTGLGGVLNKWDGTSWSQKSAYTSNFLQWADITVTDTSLIVTGNFNDLGTQPTPGIFSYSGGAVQLFPVMTGNQVIKSAAVCNGILYVISSSNQLHRWNNSGTWSLVTSNQYQQAFVYRDSLYLVEYAVSITEYAIDKMVSPTTFTEFKKLVPWQQSYSHKWLATASHDNKLFIGGSFYQKGRRDRLSLLYYNGYSVSCPGRPVVSSFGTSSSNEMAYIYCMYRDSVSGDIYAGGLFDFAGAEYASNIARFDGQKWHPMGEGFDGKVGKILKFQNEIYAFGGFTKSGSLECNRMARWDGVQWNASGSGADNVITDAEVFDNQIHICGYFTEIDSTPMQYTARYDGTNWIATGGSALQVTPRKLEIHNDSLWISANGDFGTSSFYESPMAKWNGNNWQLMLLTGTLPGYIESMYSFNNALYVSVGTWDYYYLYKWDGYSLNYIDDVYNNVCNDGSALMEINSQLFMGCQNKGLYRLDNGTDLNSVLDLRPLPLCAVSAPGKTYLGGVFPRIFRNQTEVQLNGAVVLEMDSSRFELSMLTDSVCDHDFAYFSLYTDDLFAKYRWHFPGANPDTANNAFAVTYYDTPGSFPVYLVYTNMVRTDTLFLPGMQTVLPCNTGITDLNENPVVLYPNPVSNTFSIRMDDAVEYVEVLDLTGAVVLRSETTSQIDVSFLKSGFYQARVFAKNGVWSQRFIKL